MSLRDRVCCLRRLLAGIQNRFPTSTTLSVQGIEYREGTGWPAAADIPAGTGIVWWNSTATAARLYINQAGNLHYTSFST